MLAEEIQLDLVGQFRLALLQIANAVASQTLDSGFIIEDLDGGTLDGWVRASGESAIKMSGVALKNGHFVISGDSRLQVTQGSLSTQGCLLGCDAYGIRAGGNAAADVQGLRFGLHVYEWFRSHYVRARDHADVKVVNSQGTAANVDPAFRSEGSSKLLVSDSQFQSTYRWPEEPQLPALFAATGTSRLQVDGGAYDLDVSTTSDEPWSVFTADATAEVRVDTGSFRLSYGEGVTAATVLGVLAEDQSRTEIYGGTFAFEVGDSTIRHLDVQDEATVTLFGSGFNYPLFEPLQPLEGTITGTLTDGNSIEWAFQRDATATIFLVPEPSGVLLLLIASGLCLWRRRR